ncbi:MAG: hypothetical protein ACK4UO_18285 [Pseudolabrys sp.]
MHKMPKRSALAAACLLAVTVGGAWAAEPAQQPQGLSTGTPATPQQQTEGSGAQQPNDRAQQKPDKSEFSTGRTTSPETLGQKQPQGWTGPLNTTSGGAPAESPQGQSPPGMQPAPEGSNKTMVEPEKPDEKK